jgi:hypothetical protein
MPVLISLFLFALAIVALLIGIWWGAVILVLAAIGFFAYVTLARKSGEPVGAIERGRRREPTGVPRSSSAGAETANERVGQD